MRAYLRKNLALGSQIIDGEITDPRSATDEPLRRNDSRVSLASTRSRNYTLTGGRLSDLFAEASADESSGNSSSTEAASSSDTIPYGSPAGSDPTPGGNPAPGSVRADVQARDPDSVQRSDKDEAGEGYPAAGDSGFETPRQDETRQSRRLQGMEPEHSGNRLRDSIRAASRRSARRSGVPREDTEEEDKIASDENEQKDHGPDDPEEGAGGAPPSGADQPDERSDVKADPLVQQEEETARQIARLKALLKKARRKRRKQRRGRRKTRHARKASKTFRGIVDRAKAISTLVRHSISPKLWASLPHSVRAEAYNCANGQVWDVIATSLGYKHSHLLGQLCEGDGKAAWDRMLRLHAESTSGAQAHYLAMLMKCEYADVVGSHFGGIRLYAEALQRINKQYELAAGVYVPPEVLRAKLLSLPRNYDYVIDGIEGNREDGTPLDFNSILARLVAYENRKLRRDGGSRSAPPRDRRRDDRRHKPPRRGSRHQHRAFSMQGHAPANGAKRTGGRSTIECWRCGKKGHIRAECKEKTDVDGKPIADGEGRGSYRQTAAMVKNTKRNQRFKGKPKRRVHGFLAVEAPSQARSMAYENSYSADEIGPRGPIIIDSGASVHCCVKGTPLENARATHKVIQAAGSQTLAAREIGDYGRLVDAVAVTGLRSTLASTGRLADHYQAALIYTPTEVLSMPMRTLTACLKHQRADKLGHRGDSGLYETDIETLNKTYTRERGYSAARSAAVGAIAQSATVDKEGDEGLPETLMALAVQQYENRPTGSLKRPRFRRYGKSYGGSDGVGGKARGAYPGHRSRKSGALSRPWKPGVPRPINNHRSKVRFIDLAAGIGGFTTAGIRAGWEPVASVDYCKSLEYWYSWNFQHSFECVDLTKRVHARQLLHKYRGIDVCLFAPPCQPYSLAGRRTRGDPRSDVAVAGVELMLKWRPRLIVIECVANFVSCKWNPTYRKRIAPSLTNAGYHIYVARCNAAQCGIPVRRDRVFIVATLYKRSKALEEHMEELQSEPMMPLSSWFPELELVCHVPCHSAPAVFDARMQPHPTMRTASITPLNKNTYRMRKGDAGPLRDAVELTLTQKKLLAGLDPGFHWPSPKAVCQGRCCAQYRKRRWGGSLLARSFGNIVVPQQALHVLSRCEVTEERPWQTLTVKRSVGAGCNRGRGPPREKASPLGFRHKVNVAPANPFVLATYVPKPNVTSKKRRRMPDRGRTMAAHPRDIAEKVAWLHRRMGHASKKNMKTLLKTHAHKPEWQGVTEKSIDDMGFCETCARSKLTKQPHGTLTDRRRAKGINMLIHTDTMVRNVPSIPSKHIYVQTFVDDCTRYAWVRTFKRKTFEGFSTMLIGAEAAMRNQFRDSGEYRRMARGNKEQLRPVLGYFTDHASEMVSAKQRNRLARLFIDLSVVAPSAKLSNGVAERANRTLLEYARSILVGADLPIVFWKQAFDMATYVYNRLPHAANGGRSPYELYYGHPPYDMDRIRVFGCVCYVHEEKTRRDNRSKLNATARGCVYLGPSPDDNRSHIYFNPKTSKVLRSTSVVFNEREPGGYLVANNSLVTKRMKNLTAHKWKPRHGHKVGGQKDESVGASTDDESEAATEDEPTRDEQGDDGWNRIHRVKNNDTIEMVADQFDIDMDELMHHNMGLPGCDVSTGYTDPHAKLKAGTGLWLPDDCRRRVTEEESLFPPKPPEHNGVAAEEASAGPNETMAEPSAAEEASAGPEPSGTGVWKRRLRKRASRGTANTARADPRTEDVKTVARTAEVLPANLITLIPEGTNLSLVVDHCDDIIKRNAKAVANHVKTITAVKELKSQVQAPMEEAELAYEAAYRAELFLLGERAPEAYVLDPNIRARDIPTPKSYKEALSGDFAAHWNEAVMKELKNLEDHEVWRWVETPIKKPHLIDATWAWRVKPTSTGGVDKLKARLVARGFKERFGVTYSEVFAPVTTLTTWRACLAEASKPPWKCDVWDVSSAYLLSKVPEETPIYMRPFPGLTPPSIPHKRPLILKLERCLYGLKASGRRWNATIDARLKELGFRQSSNDPCLYVKEEGEKIIRLNLHVDDCCATYTDDEFYADFKEELEKEYKLSSAADSNMFLGNVIERTKDGGLQVHQKHFVDEVLKKYDCEMWKTRPTPAPDSIHLHKGQSPQDDEERQRMANVPYRQIVGSLMWLASCTRPDLSQALGACARFCAYPGEEHWKALKWILRYLKGTRDLCLRYGRKVDDMPFGPLHGNVDGSWGDDLDDRKSTTGYNFISYGGPIVWRSQKQRSVALSSCESEYMAANEAGREAVWLARLYKEDFGHNDLSVTTYGDLSEKEFEGSLPLTIFEDNVGAIHLSRNPVAHKRSKHIEIRYHWLRDKVREGLLKLSKIDTKLNTADIFTKPTKRETFLFLRDKLMARREEPAMEVSAEAHLGKEQEAPTQCALCGATGHLEPECPLLFRPDELEEKQDPDTESKDSCSMLNAQPTSNHKGSNDAMAEEGQAQVGRLPYGAWGEEHWGHRPEVLLCPLCDALCHARHVPSKYFALEYEGECESAVWNRLEYDPPKPGEWKLQSKLSDIMDLGMRELIEAYNGEYHIGTARTHFELVIQMLDFTGAGELTIQDMFDRRRENGHPRQHVTDCEHADHDEPYAEEAPQQEVVPQEEALQQGEAPRDEESPEGGRPPKRARTGEAAGAAEATTAGSGK